MEGVERLMRQNVLDFYRGKRVFVTGHTGFKGAWLCRILERAGAKVTGYSLQPPTTPSLFSIAKVQDEMTSIIGDVRNFEMMKKAFDDASPEIVFHLAAQPIVRDSYKEPRYTYETNVMGTVNLLECVRLCNSVRSVLNITTDKVYQNNEWVWGYREDEPLDGFDPYSNSKSCSELVTHSYMNSFFGAENAPAISTARAGNVIGGGDFANDRIVPDCIRAQITHQPIYVRNPYSTRPYQHVLEPLFAYLIIAKEQYEDKQKAGWYNVGPDDCDCLTTGELVELFCKIWGEDATWMDRSEVGAPHEANFLKLDCSKIKTLLGWRPTWHIQECIEMTCKFSKAMIRGKNIQEEMDREIESFIQQREKRSKENS